MLRIVRGLPRELTGDAAALVAEAFRRKLRPALGGGPRVRTYLARVIDPGQVVCALAPGGRLVGVAGIKTATGGFVGGDLRDLAAVYGWPGAIWRAAVLLALATRADDSCLQLDSICVAADARGRGVGTALLDAVAAEAARQGFGALCLDVVDRNPRARALYERHGFRVHRIRRLGLFGPLFGFASVARMQRPLDPPSGARNLDLAHQRHVVGGADAAAFDHPVDMGFARPPVQRAQLFGDLGI